MSCAELPHDAVDPVTADRATLAVHLPASLANARESIRQEAVRLIQASIRPRLQQVTDIKAGDILMWLAVCDQRLTPATIWLDSPATYERWFEQATQAGRELCELGHTELLIADRQAERIQHYRTAANHLVTLASRTTDRTSAARLLDQLEAILTVIGSELPPDEYEAAVDTAQTLIGLMQRPVTPARQVAAE